MRLETITFVCVACLAGCGEDDEKASDSDPNDTTETVSDTGAPADGETSAETSDDDSVAETAEDTQAPDITDTADTTDISEVDTSPTPADFSCLGTDQPFDPGDGEVALEFLLVDYVTAAPIAGVHARFCSRVDPDCAHPLAEADSNADGVMRATVPAGFDGQIEAEGGGISPVIQMVDTRIVVSPEQSLIRLVTPAVAAGFAAVYGVTLDPAAGHIVFAAFDCGPAPAAGTTIELSGMPEGMRYAYLAGGLPSADATSTDASGAAAAFNIAQGGYFARARTGDEAPFGRAQVLVRAGWITQVFIAPHQSTPDLSCDGAPEMPIAFTGEVAWSVAVRSFVTNKAMAGAHVKVCAADDLTCATPLAEGDADENGWVEAVLPMAAGGFDGFLDVTGDGIFPARFFYNPPLVTVDELPRTLSVAVLTLVEADLFAEFSGAVIDPELAQAAVSAGDCKLRGMHGATVTTPALTDSSKIIYLEEGFPAPGSRATDDSGTAGFFNLAIGEAEFIGFYGDTRTGGLRMPLAKGYLHSINLIPSP